MKLSRFGQQFAPRTGIADLMDDLIEALVENPDMISMGGGNPAHIPAVEAACKAQLQAIAQSDERQRQLLGIYASPQGDSAFRKSIARLLKNELGWAIGPENIALSNGSQSAFFLLFNLIAGEMSDGSRHKIQLPLCPEYMGYMGSGMGTDFFRASRPTIELLDQQLFKYHVNFDQLDIGDDVAALCLSRPTNPTSNVVTNDELHRLDLLAQARDIPLIIDAAYGLPFPGITFTNVEPLWNENCIAVLSLSKLGMPAARTGIIVASEEVIEAYTHANGAMNLACGSFGPTIAQGLVDSGEILRLSNKSIRPFYQQRADSALQEFRRALDGLPYRIHKPEGAIFLWLWFEDLPISAQVLYERLKDKGVLVVPGQHFFPGLDEDWAHKQECIRVTYAQPDDRVKRGIAIIAEEVAAAYG